jgi:AP endonuclease 2
MYVPLPLPSPETVANPPSLLTGWNTRISARESNYGTRVDYILVTRGLLPWIKAADIEPSVKGSDHCPVWVDLREEVVVEGRVERLREVMFCDGAGAGREPPRLAARYWEEYSGRQTLLSTFFGKGGSAGGNKDVVAPFSKVDTGKTKSGVVDMEVSVGELSNTLSPTSPDPNTDRDREPTQSPSSAPSTPPHPPPSFTPPTFLSPAPSPAPTPQQPPTTHPRAPSLAQYPHEPKKRKQPDEPSSKSKKKKAGQKPKQTKLSTFFVQPSTSSSTASSSSPIQTPPSKEEQEQLEADYKLALELSASQQDLLSQAHPTPAPKQNTNQAQAWSHLLSPLQPPLCLIHKEPTKELTVTKPGPNKGKNFFICSRPVGPGYDRGRGERLREEVNHSFKCGFFKWGSEVRRDALREGAGA